jgi:hypothetical protein
MFFKLKSGASSEAKQNPGAPSEAEGKIVFVYKNTSCSPLWRGSLAEGFSQIFRIPDFMILQFDHY